MLSPASLKGLKYTHDNAGGSISYLGLSVPIENIDSGIFKEISLAALNIYKGNLPLTKTKDGYYAVYDNMKLYFNSMGYLTSLKYNDIEITFLEHKKT